MRYRLCALDDIPEGESRGFDNPAPPEQSKDRRGLFAVRRNDQVYVYRNRCPHHGLELHWAADRFLTKDKQRILCAAHAAQFEFEDGTCVVGPCYGMRLDQIACEIEDNGVYVTLRS